MSMGLLAPRTSIKSGDFHDILGMHHENESNFNLIKFEQYIIPNHYKVIFSLILKALKKEKVIVKQISYVIYQNMSFNDLHSFASAMGLEGKVFFGGLKNIGHVFGSDLVINYCLAKKQHLIQDKKYILFVSSGAGYNWGVTLIKT